MTFRTGSKRYRATRCANEISGWLNGFDGVDQILCGLFLVWVRFVPFLELQKCVTNERRLDRQLFRSS